jgi:hypothetical protein
MVVKKFSNQYNKKFIIDSLNLLFKHKTDEYSSYDTKVKHLQIE